MSVENVISILPKPLKKSTEYSRIPIPKNFASSRTVNQKSKLRKVSKCFTYEKIVYIANEN